MMSGCQTVGPRFLATEVEERRETSRFPLQADVRYKLIRAKSETAGAGKTLNMGSGGVLFTTEHRLALGQTIEVEIDWPALLDGRCLLKLVVSGPIVRAGDDHAVMRISRYDFRTRRSRQ